jgi:hypothetical protein
LLKTLSPLFSSMVIGLGNLASMLTPPNAFESLSVVPEITTADPGSYFLIGVIIAVVPVLSAAVYFLIKTRSKIKTD